MTDVEFAKFKSFVGTYEKGKNYNQIIDGHGTGLIPPTKEQWEEMKNQPILVDKIEFPSRQQEFLQVMIIQATNWFPPIGNQGYPRLMCFMGMRILYKNFSGSKRTQLGSFRMFMGRGLLWTSKCYLSG